MSTDLYDVLKNAIAGEKPWTENPFTTLGLGQDFFRLGLSPRQIRDHARAICKSLRVQWHEVQEEGKSAVGAEQWKLYNTVADILDDDDLYARAFDEWQRQMSEAKRPGRDAEERARAALEETQRLQKQVLHAEAKRTAALTMASKARSEHANGLLFPTIEVEGLNPWSITSLRADVLEITVLSFYFSVWSTSRDQRTPLGKLVEAELQANPTYPVVRIGDSKEVNSVVRELRYRWSDTVTDKHWERPEIFVDEALRETYRRCLTELARTLETRFDIRLFLAQLRVLSVKHGRIQVARQRRVDLVEAIIGCVPLAAATDISGTVFSLDKLNISNAREFLAEKCVPLLYEGGILVTAPPIGVKLRKASDPAAHVDQLRLALSHDRVGPYLRTEHVVLGFKR